jgi:hypothetical protein
LATAASTTVSITGVMSSPVPSPSMYGMIGSSGTLSDMSALTVIFWPRAGTWMCWYMKGKSPMDASWRRSADGVGTCKSAARF